MIRLRALRFDRTVGGSSAAIPLAARSSSAPAPFDWQRSNRNHPQPVAYPRTATAATLTLEFEFSTPLATPLLIRASASGRSPLGDVATFEVGTGTFGSCRANAVADASPLPGHAVGAATVTWLWAWSDDAGRTWHDFDTSVHPVYVLLRDPCFPWGGLGSVQRVTPWFDPVDVACRLAAGATAMEDVMAALTAAVHGLGGKPILDQSGNHRTIGWQSNSQYHATSAGKPIFRCSAFINLMRLCPTEFYRICCQDCASGVATFATVLGVDVDVTTIEPRDDGGLLTLNPIWLLGDQRPVLRTFTEHIVTTRGRDRSLRVWDACLRLDFDAGPHADWHLSTGLAFDTAAFDDYRDRLMHECEPRPRAIPLRPSFPDRAPAQAELWHNPVRASKRSRLLRIVEGYRPTWPLVARDAVELLQQIQGVRFDLVEQRATEVCGREQYLLTAPFNPPEDPYSTLQIGLATTDNPEHARDVFIDLLTDYTAPLRPVSGLGDCAFYCDADESAVIVFGAIVAQLRNDPARPVRIRATMRRIGVALQTLTR